jgi:hypothetical protein
MTQPTKREKAKEKDLLTEMTFRHGTTIMAALERRLIIIRRRMGFIRRRGEGRSWERDRRKGTMAGWIEQWIIRAERSEKTRRRKRRM